MGDSELGDRLDDLFSGAMPEQEPLLEPEAEEKEEGSLLEETVIASLLEGRGVDELVAAEALAKAPPSVLEEMEGAQEEQEPAPLTGVPSWKVTLGRRRFRVLNILLYGVIILGGLPLIFLLIALIGRRSVTWSGFHTLYCAAYTVAVVVTLIQWLFNSSLTSVIRETEEQRVEAVRSQKLLKGRVEELASANALLQRRALQFQTASQVCHAISSVLDRDELMQQTVNLIREHFDLYYVGLFLVDESRKWAVLQAGTGEAGSRMVAQGYKLGMSNQSVVVRCITSGRARVARERATAQSWPSLEALEDFESARFDGAIEVIQLNPLLLETRSQMALPLHSRGQVIGALDVHSTRQGAFSEEDIPVLQMLADQVTVAIENAQVHAGIQARLEELEELERGLARERRSRIMPDRVSPLYERRQPDVTSLGDVVQPEVEQAVTQREVVVQSDVGDGVGRAALVAPISLRGEVIGALGLQEVDGRRQWTQDEIALIESIADQMALAIENARLLEATQQRAERERLIAEISSRVRASLDPDTILKTTVHELGRVLGAERASVEIVGSEQGGDGSTGEVAVRRKGG